MSLHFDTLGETSAHGDVVLVIIERSGERAGDGCGIWCIRVYVHPRLVAYRSAWLIVLEEIGLVVPNVEIVFFANKILKVFILNAVAHSKGMIELVVIIVHHVAVHHKI